MRMRASASGDSSAAIAVAMLRSGDARDATMVALLRALRSLAFSQIRLRQTKGNCHRTAIFPCAKDSLAPKCG